MGNGRRSRLMWSRQLRFRSKPRSTSRSPHKRGTKIIEQLHLGFAAAGEAIGGLTLDRRKERFHHGVIVTVAAAAHRARDSIRIEHPLVVFARIRAALVGVV